MMGKRKHERSKSMKHRERSSSSSSCERVHKKYKKSKMKKRHRSCSWDESQSVVMARRGRKQRSDSISDSSSDTSSDSPSSSSSSEDCKHKTTKKKRKSADKKKKRKKKKKKHKYHKKKDDKLLKPETASQLNVGPVADPKKGQKSSSNTLDAQRRMAPMTKDEWERQQSVTRRVYDPDTGRTRLVRGSGEIVEEIVSKERQKEINKQATIGDGLSYQRAAGLL